MNNYNKNLGEEPSLALSSPRPPTFPKDRRQRDAVKRGSTSVDLLNSASELSDLKRSGPESFIENLAQGITVKRLSEELRIPVKTIYDWIYRKILPPECILRINGRVRLDRMAVGTWLLSQQKIAS